ncbi:hypothetical protein [Amycolatopsis sp. NPDC004169]|uniref:hypothetical protein n=1 Tax=Amycolatopsis sp. NPDC004169 TaxID=3154453 RepID=UPI0033AA58D1
MESEELSTRAVGLVAEYLANAVARIPGSPQERLYLLLAEHMHRSPDGFAIFGELESAPGAAGKRRVAAAKLIELVDQDRRFAAELRRAVREILPSAADPLVHNTIGGNNTGAAVQAASITGSTIGHGIDQSHHVNRSRRTRVSFGGIVLIIVLALGLGATAVVVAVTVISKDLGAAGNPGPGTGSGSGPIPGEGVAPPSGDPAAGNGCGRAERPVLSLSPDRGPASTKITVSGVGFIPSGHVNIEFHASQMGEATTDCHGVFSVTLPIPQKNFYRHFAGQSFDVHATEWTSGGQYQGNGDFNGAQFYLTG